MQKKSLSHFTHIVARDLVNVPIQMQFYSLVTIAKQCKLDEIKITRNSIIATEKQYNLLIKKLIECIYQN